MPQRVNIGVIGCGAMAGGHMGTLAGMEGVHVVAVCDVVEESARSAASRVGAEAYSDFEKMLERDDIHGVYLCLPVFAHGDPELAVIRRGLPFYVEKPVARTMDVARRVLAEVEKRNLITCAGYQLRYGGGTAAARRLLAGKRIGLVAGTYWCGTGRMDPSCWQLQYARSGGQILEQATHTLDMMRFLCGDVTEVVTRRANRELMDIDCADVHTVLLTFKSGCLGSLTTTWAYDPDDWSHANVIHITYEDKLLRWTVDAVTVSGAGESSEPVSDAERDADAVFVEAVRTGVGSALLSPYADAVRSLELALAVNESGETGRPVRIGDAL